MKETKEALVALALLGKLVADRVKDGVDLSDAVAVGQALMIDGEFKNKVAAGYKDADKIGEEFKTSRSLSYRLSKRIARTRSDRKGLV